MTWLEGTFDVARYLVALVVPLGIAIAAFMSRRLLRGRGGGIGLRDALLWLFMKEARRRVSVAVNIRRYCRTILKDDKYAKLLIPGRRDAHASIENVFVDLRMDHAANEGTEFTNATLLDAGSRLRIIGDPGSGKSSLVKWVLRDSCKSAMLTPIRSRLPIFIELKAFPVPAEGLHPHDLGEWALAHVRQRVVALEGHMMNEFFDHCVRSNRSGVLLLLDGLDEVVSEDCNLVVQAVNALGRRLAELSPQNIMVVTMRSQFHEQVRRSLAEEFPLALWVRPFTPADIFEFLTRWFETRQDGASLALDVYNELSDRPNLRDMCGNPLTLSMYVASHRDTESVAMPDTRTEFYQQVTRELLVMRRSRQQSNRDARLAQKRQRDAVFGRLALENMLDAGQSSNSLLWERGLAVTAEVGGVSDPEGVLRDLGVHTGIFTEERAGETFRFIHLTFCEFFAALEAAQNRASGWQLLLNKQREFQSTSDHPARYRLIEVIPFATALLPNAHTAGALSEVLDLGDMELYGRCLLETQEYYHEGWQTYVDGEYQFFARSDKRDWNEGWLRRLHLYRTVIEDARVVANRLGRPLTRTVSLDDLFSGLVGADKARLVQIFSSYAAQDPVAALRLARVCGVDMLAEAPQMVSAACEVPAFLALAMDQAGGDSSAVEDWAGVLVEAALHKLLVAATLANAPIPRRIENRVAEIAPAYRWNLTSRSRLGAVPTSYYDGCLTILSGRLLGEGDSSLHTSRPSTIPAGRLRLLRLIGPPVVALRRAQRRRRYGHVLLLGTVAAYIAVVGLVLDNERPNWPLAVAVMVLYGAFISIGYLMLISPLAARIALGTALNMRASRGGLWTRFVPMRLALRIAGLGRLEAAYRAGRSHVDSSSLAAIRP